ncbi:MAG: phosphopantetheine-binding protein [Chloroflexota bacterium]|nr:phosphopantetheine-binding protein [Chloroflexota bacterium]
MKNDIIQTLETYLKDDILQQPDRAIAPDEALISSGLIDSFSLVDVALFVEDTYGITIDDTELNAETFDTLDALADLISERRDD